MDRLYVAHDNQELGPYSLEEIRALIREGALSPDDLAQSSGMGPSRPLSAFLSPTRRPFPIGKILLLLAGFALFSAVLLALALLYKPLDEWLGLSRAAFDQRAIEQEHLPKNASRAFSYNTGFVDSTTWVAYSADKETLERSFRDLSTPSGKVTDWPPSEGLSPADPTKSYPFLPISSPARAEWRNRGYWDLNPKARGKYYDSQNDPRSVRAFYDTETSRLYYITED